MGGCIDVESRPGAGATFAVRLPFKQQSDAVEATPALPSALDGLRVLIVDDNATNREILSRQLRAWSCSVVPFGDPKEALFNLQSMTSADEVPGLILLDYHMPGIDGLEACQAIRRMEHLTNTPILILTSVSFLGRRRELDRAGADGQLTKPVKQTQLRGHILTVLGLQQQFGSQDKKRTSHLITEFDRSVAEARKRTRILLVEDNAVNQRIGVALLTRAGYQSEVANNGKEALAALARMPFNLVLMDCQMPVMDGYQAARALRRREAKVGGHIPIIAMTANVMEGDRQKCLDAGMDDYVAKPVVSEELYQKLQHWLDAPDQDLGKTA